MTRRTLLQGSMWPAGEPGWIDAHVHVWPADTGRYSLASGFTKSDMQPASFTPEELLEHARPCGVRRVVLIQMSYYGFDNSYMLDSMRRFPGVFAGVARVDDAGPDPAGEMRRLKLVGVRGFRVHPGKDAGWLDKPGMAAMWQCGAEERMAMCPLIDPDALPALDRMCRRFPETTVVIDHYARIGVDGTIREEHVKQLCGLAVHPRVHVKLSAFYALGQRKYPYTDILPMTRRLIDAYGPGRLMWATDCPFQVQNGHTYRGSLEVIQERLDGVSAADREWLLAKTAERVFFA